MQLQHLTEEPTVAIPPTLSTQQKEQMPAPPETLFEAEAIQTNVGPEAIQAETLSPKLVTSQETAASIGVTLAKMQRQWEYSVRLNAALFLMSLAWIHMTFTGTLGHLSYLHGSQYSGIALPDLGLIYFKMAGVLFASILVCGVLKIRAQRKFNSLTQTVVEIDDIRAVGPLARAFSMQRRKGHRKLRDLILAAIKKLLSLHSNEPDAAGPLAEALTVGDRKLRAEVIAALTPLLTRLRTEDTAQFSTEQLMALNFYLIRDQYILRENDVEGSF